MDTVKSCISRRFLFSLVLSTFLRLHCPANFPGIDGQLGQQVSNLPSASRNYTLEYQGIKECEGSAFPGLVSARRVEIGEISKIPDLCGSHFIFLIICNFSCIHYPLSELFQVITKKNHPKCECPFR